jgi:hypothetical protein
MEEQGYTFWGTCKGTTKAGSPCRRTVVYANGYCRAHGGDSTEFMRERFEKIKARAIARSKRFTARLERRYGPLKGK